MKISVHDIVLEEDMDHLKKGDVTVELRLGARSLHSAPLGSNSPPVPVPLSTQISNEHINFICTGKGMEQNIGSVSIPQFIILNGGLNTYKQWITLFEHEEDDEYDGEMGLNDDEQPMLLITFEICQDEQPVSPAVKRDSLSKTTAGAQQ